MDYKQIFECDSTPRLIFRWSENRPFSFIDANKQARALFNVKDIKGIAPSLVFDDIFIEAVSQEISTLNNNQDNSRQTSVYYRSKARLNISVLNRDEAVYELQFHFLEEEDTTLKFERDDAVSMLSSIFEVTEVGIIVTDENGVVVNVNKGFSRIYGWPQDQVVNQKFEKLVAPEMRDRIIQNHERFIKYGVRSTGEMKIMRADGSTADTLSTTSTLLLSQNRKFQVTTITDISIRKRMENSLRKAKEEADIANKAKSSFLANMSHELRTPLNAIIGFSEMMMNHAFGPVGHEKYDEYLGDVHFSAKHLLDIINEVLDMSKIEAGRMKLEDETLNLTTLIKGVQKFVQVQSEQKNISIETHLPEDVPHVSVDARLFKQILINIVTNAIKYTDDDGQVKITAAMEKKDLVLSVTDTGVGIPEYKIKDALEPFGQISSEALYAQSREGTGLGLPIAKGMMELHDGTLRLSSTEGIGTRVDLVLPAERLVKQQRSVAMKLDKPLFDTSRLNSQSETRDSSGLLA